MEQDFKLLELTSTDVFPPTEVHNLPKQHHQPGTKCSNTQTYGGHLHPNYYSIIAFVILYNIKYML